MIKFFNIIFTLFFMPTILILSIFSKKIRAGIKEKFGFYDFNFQDKENILWFHCVSLGEVQLVSDLIPKLKNFKIVLTTTTPQGQEFAQKKLKDYCLKITYFPYDFNFSTKSAIKAINPKAVYIAETEMWPMFARNLKEQNIPLTIFNGRISDRTFKSYKKLSFFFKKILENYAKILTQTSEDREKFIKIGASEDKVSVMGNIKFDIEKPENPNIPDLALGQNPLLIAGSTHKNEDEIIIKTFKNLKKDFKNLKLLIAPRHLERVPYIQSLEKNIGLKTVDDFEKCDILLLNTTGELKNIYSIATIVIMCGSFDKTGGHNPLEATIWEKPVITGNNIKNFKLIYKNLIELNCAKIVQNQQELETSVRELLSDNSKLEKMKENCRKVFEKNKGATDYLINYIKGNNL